MNGVRDDTVASTVCCAAVSPKPIHVLEKLSNVVTSLDKRVNIHNFFNIHVSRFYADFYCSKIQLNTHIHATQALSSLTAMIQKGCILPALLSLAKRSSREMS